MVAKSPDAFRTISEVAEDLDLPQHVLRFWETRFTQIKPLKRGGGRRYYRPDDVDLLRGIRLFLYGEGYTIRGVQRILKEQGVRFVMAAGKGELTGMMPGRPDPRRFEDDDDGGDIDGAFDHDGDEAEAAFEPRPQRAPPVRHLPLRPEPEFDVEPEDHDPDDEPRHLAPYAEDRAAPEDAGALLHDDDDDGLDDDDGIRRMAERFAPAAPPPATPRREPPPPPRAAAPRPPPRPGPPPRPEPPPARAPNPLRPDVARQEPSRGPAPEPAATPALAPRPQSVPQPAPQPIRHGLSREDVAQLQDIMAELLELKRILDQAR